MDSRLSLSQIPYLEFEDAKREIFIECRRLMTEKLHYQYPHIDKSLVEADVKAFLGAHRFDSTLLSPTRVRSSTVVPLVTPSRRDRSGRSARRSFISSLRRSPTPSVGSRSGHRFKIPTTPRPRLARMNAVASSSSSTSIGTTAGFASRSPSTPTRRLSPVTPQSRMPRTPLSRTPLSRTPLSRTPQSRTPQTRVARAARSSMIGFGALKNAYEECNGNKDSMVRYLSETYPAISIYDIKQDVDLVIGTLRR